MCPLAVARFSVLFAARLFPCLRDFLSRVSAAHDTQNHSFGRVVVSFGLRFARAMHTTHLLHTIITWACARLETKRIE